MNEAIHHLHRRKRAPLEPYPHPNAHKRFVDQATYFAAIICPIMTIPQFVKILLEQSAESISILSWGTYTIVAAIWLWYGILHKEPQIIIMNCALLILDIAIVVAALWFGTSLV